MFRGTFTALVTPFRDGDIDVSALEDLIEKQIAAGITGIVAIGTTGESPTLSHDEREQVIRVAVAKANKRCLVLAGTGSNATQHAIDDTKLAEKLGVDAALLVAPYYNKPSQEGLFRHFKAIAAATSLPIVLYNIPGRCGVEISVDTVKRLARDCKNIIGIKEAGGNSDRVSQLRAALGPRFEIMCGDDALTLSFMAVGAQGVISVASNVVPRQVARMVQSATAGQSKVALKLHETYYSLFKDLFLESNPVPIKAALAMMGQIREEYRLPLVPMSAKNRQSLRATMKKCGVLR